MSYSMGYPVVVAHAQAEARAAFIRRTYGHLAGAILAFIALETVLLQLPGIENVVISMIGGRFSWLLVLGAFMFVSYLANSWAQSNASQGLQYAGLALYVVAEAVIFLPLLYIAAYKTGDPNLIPAAGITTLAIFGGLTLAVFVTGRDFSFLRTVLTVGCCIALGVIITSCLFQFSLGLFFCYAMVALIAGCILYSTSNVLYHYRTDQHVAASLALFASVATLFWYILMIFMDRRN